MRGLPNLFCVISVITLMRDGAQHLSTDASLSRSSTDHAVTETVTDASLKTRRAAAVLLALLRNGF